MLVKLYRDSFETPWGFRLQGGKDLNQALVVQRVFSNSPAEGELQRGDIILSINGRDSASFTHKQAQDAIKFAGGQIELNVQRPSPGSVHIQPLTPSSPTRAPSNIFNRRTSDTTQSKMPPPIAGHAPRKVTLNKFGGGTTSFGQSFQSKKKSSSTWQPVGAPSGGNMMNRVQDSLDSALSPTGPPQGYYQQQQYQQPQQQQYRQPPQQQQYKPPPQQQYQPPPQQQQYQPPPQQQYQPPPPQQQYQPPPPQQQYQPPQNQYHPQPQQEPYTPTYQTVGDLQPDYVRAEDPVPEEDYEYTSVRDRKQQFVETRQEAPQLKRGKKKFVPPVAAGYQSFGTDYSSPQPKEVEQPRFPPVARPTQAPVNRAPEPVDQFDGPKPWAGSLRCESGGPKLWELEDKEYIMPSQLEAMQQQRQSRGQTRQQRQPPAVSPKPKAKGTNQVKVAVAAPKQSPARQISVRSVSNDATDGASGPQAVHLQYNSPMGLYSRDNINKTYQAQIGDSEETSSTVSKQQPKQPQQQQQPGDRDWNQSYVYKMVKEETKRETQTYPGQAPVTTQTYSSKTYQTGQPPQGDTYGISDF